MDGHGADDGNEGLDDFETLSTVMRALTPLPEERRARIIQTVITFFGMEGRSAPRVQPALSTAQDAGEPGGYSEDRTPSPKEFLVEKRPSTDVDRVACLAYYLTHYRDTPHFKTIDISKLNTEAAQTKFSNAARSVDNAAQAGFLVPATKGNKQLSAIAELYVQALPDKSAAKAAVAGARPKRKRKAKRSTASGDTQ